MKKNRISKDETINFLLKCTMASLFVIGAILFFYPFVADALNNYLDQQRISYYIEKNETENQAKLAKQAKEMAEKNQALKPDLSVPGMTDVKDPFATINDHADKAQKAYYQQHNIGAIFIPAIEVSLPLFDTTNDTLLAEGATVLQGTSFPVGGKDTHSVITGHTGLPDKTIFTQLTELKKGNMIYLHVAGKKLAYKIFEFKVVKPDHLDDLKIVAGRDLITLVTCTPYMINTDRLLVTAERVPYREADMKQAVKKTQQYHRLKLVYTLIAVASFFGLFFGWLGRKIWLLVAQRRNYQAVFVLEQAGQPVVNQAVYLVHGFFKKEVQREQQRYVVVSDETGTIRIEGVPGNHYRVCFVEAPANWPVIRLRLKRLNATRLWVKVKASASRVEGKGLLSRIVYIQPKKAKSQRSSAKQ